LILRGFGIFEEVGGLYYANMKVDGKDVLFL